MKLVRNTCYGGFGLSHEAIKRYFELRNWKLVAIKWDRTYTTYEEIDLNNDIPGVCYYKDFYGENNGFYDHEIDRTDPILIQVVEELGEKANGSSSSLAVEEIPDDVEYEIYEYDGIESIEAPRKYLY